MTEEEEKQDNIHCLVEGAKIVLEVVAKYAVILGIWWALTIPFR